MYKKYMYSKLGRRLSNEEFDFKIKNSGFIRVTDYINSKTTIVFKCKVCGREFRKPPKEFGKLSCSCVERESEYLNFIKSKNIEIIEPYVSARTKINHKCLLCNLVFKSSPKVVKNSIIGCPSCSGKIFSIEKYKSLLPKDIEIASTKYLGSNTPCKHKCLRCDFIWETKPCYILYMGCGCPKCALSKGERKVSLILDELNFQYIHQCVVNINNINYKFDFYIKDIDLYIEFDGIQHFYPIIYFGGESQFDKIKKNDRIKDDWIIKNNHKILRISYLDNIEYKLKSYLNKNIIMENKIMKYLEYFNESKKDKFPNVKKLDIDGFVVYLGRDAKSNDYLTFNMADKRDIWMHVKGVPGSHVVIRVKDNLPTETTIKKAAELAKKNSKSPQDKKATVVYCQQRFIKKEVGMNDGQVRVDYINSHEIQV